MEETIRLWGERKEIGSGSWDRATGYDIPGDSLSRAEEHMEDICGFRMHEADEHTPPLVGCCMQSQSRLQCSKSVQ